MKRLLLPLFLVPFLSYAAQANINKITEIYCDLFGKASVEAFKTTDSPDAIAQKTFSELNHKGFDLREIHSNKDEFIATIKQTVTEVRKNKQAFPSPQHFDESLDKSVKACKEQTRHALSQGVK
ncbi:hypothetical protein HZS38_05230 [Xenorhabdus nematophila]|uniref:Uncharacterized protein n=2 Tax=Xenorhabdus nematophila TaxID=628 RepID=D3VIB4_XENNA|nr:hypothetical protein [Xenorhabdus nematophila]CEE90186.1 hypothetical protein; putative exported protein [Xenorhabdus nematophila str. Anatoliense]CEF30713.1 hypothetical protein; putative exported protein [Xenorhabdus nematophila str. Websteri]AYA39961.1 hypothetical protein D3790_05315 [Xenorhabdus nematophila]KHD29151.1 hypothetical protein LH67_05220 [Xenorhabdus nematophila]MBA0018596.1 hypothetical protein [Xenorhabdus nematophila]